MKLRGWQVLEIVGAALVLLGLGLEVFVRDVETLVDDTDAAILEQRLTLIYDAARAAGRSYVERAPLWEDVETFFAGPEIPDDNHARFAEVHARVVSVPAVLFILGAAAGLLGKCLEFRAANREPDALPADRPAAGTAPRES